MYIIVGLGNPSPEYAGTRHNVGFEVVGILADRFDIPTDYIKHKAVCGKGVIEGNKVLLAMPQTFMNLSGESVRELVSYFKIDVTSELIVVYDDVTGATYELSDRGRFDYRLFEQDGELLVEKRSFTGGPDDGELLAIGRVLQDRYGLTEENRSKYCRGLLMIKDDRG